LCVVSSPPTNPRTDFIDRQFDAPRPTAEDRVRISRESEARKTGRTINKVYTLVANDRFYAFHLHERLNTHEEFDLHTVVDLTSNSLNGFMMNAGFHFSVLNTFIFSNESRSSSQLQIRVYLLGFDQFEKI